MIYQWVIQTESEDDDYEESGSDGSYSDDVSCDDEDVIDRAWINDGHDPNTKHVDVYLENENVKTTYVQMVYRNGYFYEDRGFGHIRLKEWVIFVDKTHFMEVLKDYCIQEGFDIVKLKVDRMRFTCECASEGCDWRLHASLLPDGHSFVIKTIHNSNHKCQRLEENPMASCEWLVGKILGEVRANPDIPVTALQQICLERYGVTVKKRLMYKARTNAKEEIDGAFDKSYGKIPDYLDVLQQTNPGSYTHYTISKDSEGTMKFKNYFFSFPAQYRGFIKGCRPLIGVDGCHLKGHYGGVVLSAIGVDGNGKIFPIAYGVVQKECKEAWTYFLTMLKHVLTNAGPRKWTFISDRQKGVEPALEEVFPHCARRICCTHLYANFRKSHPEANFRVYFWQAADATSKFMFLKAMDRIKALSMDAYQYLMNIPLDTWATFKFDPSVCNSENTSNFVESFNSTLELDRHKPILNLLKGIRRNSMIRISERQSNAERWDNDGLYPDIEQKLKVIERESRFSVVHRSGLGEFEVREGVKTLTVDINKRICLCGQWQVTGIPCRHAYRCLVTDRKDIKHFVHPYYSVQTYKMAYNEIIHPIPNPETWPKFNNPLISPLIVSRRIGRPARCRRLEENEKRKAKRHVTKKCKLCGEFGHNKRGCKGGATRKEKVAAATNARTALGGLHSVADIGEGVGDAGVGDAGVSTVKKRGRKKKIAP